MRQADRQILEKMCGYCDDGASIVEQCGGDVAYFADHFVYQYAGSMCIMQMGELVTKLPEEVLAAAPQVPWRLIRGARNIHAHDYARVKPETIWDSLVNDFPALRRQLQTLLDAAEEI